MSLTSCTGRASQTPLATAWINRAAISPPKLELHAQPINPARYTSNEPIITGRLPNFRYIGTVTSVPMP